MNPLNVKQPIENGWVFGLKWSSTGVLASLVMLAGCSFFDIDENKERHNNVYGERKIPQLNPQAPRAKKINENDGARQVRAELEPAAPATELTPFDQYNSQASVNAAPQPASPSFDAPVRAANIGALVPQQQAEPIALAPLPEVVAPVQPRALPKENQEILGEDTPSIVAEPVAPAPVIERATYEPPVIRTAPTVDAPPAREVRPVIASDVAPAYHPPAAEPLYVPPALSTPAIAHPAGTLGTITYHDEAPAPVVSAPVAQPSYAYRPYQPPLPVTATAPAPTPVGPLVLNAPEEALQTERYLPSSRYTTRRTYNRRVNAY